MGTGTEQGKETGRRQHAVQGALAELYEAVDANRRAVEAFLAASTGPRVAREEKQP